MPLLLVERPGPKTKTKTKEATSEDQHLGIWECEAVSWNGEVHASICSFENLFEEVVDVLTVLSVLWPSPEALKPCDEAANGVTKLPSQATPI